MRSPGTFPDAKNCDAAAQYVFRFGDRTESGRKFFLDYPCDLKAGEPIAFILNFHGGGSIGNCSVLTSRPWI